VSLDEVRKAGQVPPACECGAAYVTLNGMTWCAATLAKYRARYGEPTGGLRPRPPGQTALDLE
jgi:hypothetical protein